jgi:hypothetical protein
VLWLMIFSGLCAWDQPFRQSDCLLVFFLDTHDFMCLTCLDSFLEICRALPPEVRRERTVVVLTEKKGSEEISTRSKRITLKKLQALFRSNGFSLPVCLDDLGLFLEIRGKADIVIFAPGSGDIKAFSLPLSPTEVRQVLNSIRP